MLDVSAAVAQPSRSLAKDPLLVLRDRYWVLTLQRLARGKSFAALERELCPHLHIRDRGNGEGGVQPHALSKVAVGARGLSPSLGRLPRMVAAAELRYPGSSQAYTSLLWHVLACAREERIIERPTSYVCQAVVGRFDERHQTLVNGSASLNRLGVSRAGRITHIDALGLLLWIYYPLSGCRGLDFWAATYVRASVERLCLKDPLFASLRDEIVQLIVERLPGAMPIDQPFASRTFQCMRGLLTTVPGVKVK